MNLSIGDEVVLDLALWRELVKYRDGYRCVECGESSTHLAADHVNGIGDDNRLANGQSLCPRCHGRKTGAGVEANAEHRTARINGLRRYAASVTAEQRRENMRKAWDTRRATTDVAASAAKGHATRRSLGEGFRAEDA